MIYDIKINKFKNPSFTISSHYHHYLVEFTNDAVIFYKDTSGDHASIKLFQLKLLVKNFTYDSIFQLVNVFKPWEKPKLKDNLEVKVSLAVDRMYNFVDKLGITNCSDLELFNESVGYSHFNNIMYVDIESELAKLQEYPTKRFSN